MDYPAGKTSHSAGKVKYFAGRIDHPAGKTNHFASKTTYSAGKTGYFVGRIGHSAGWIKCSAGKLNKKELLWQQTGCLRPKPARHRSNANRAVRNPCYGDYQYDLIVYIFVI